LAASSQARCLASADNLMWDVGFKPATAIEDGIARFVEWYKSYYKIS